MNPRVFKLVNQIVSERVAALWPSAQQIAVTAPKHYRFWTIDPKILPARYFILVVTGKSDSFTIELAWSIDGVLPTVFHDPYDEYPISARFRISRLWQRYGNADWWTVEDEFPYITRPDLRPDLATRIERVPFQVEQCFRKVEEYAVPFFNSILEKHS